MSSPRPSLDSSTSIVSSSGSDVSEEGDVPFPTPQAPVVPTSTSTKTTVTVGKIEVQEGARVPGVLNGTLVNSHLNIIINRLDVDDDEGPVDLNGFVTDAVKINAEKVKSYLTTDYNSSSTKLTGTKEEVEGLSRRWCYLISALVTLSLITLLGTAVLSLTSWRTTHGSIPALTPATHATVAGLSAEEKHFSGVPNGPRIVTRSVWLAAPSKKPLDRNTLPVPLVVVCHTATGKCTSQPECIYEMRAMQRYHQETRGYDDLGYNFLIGGDGSVYWSRGFGYVGAHTRGFNKGSIAIAFIGNYIEDVPSESQKEAFQKLVQVGIKEGKISPDYTLVAQCQLRVTSAPGLALVREMTSWPHYNSSLPVKCTTT